jgi:hypothetical protein
MPIYRLEPIEGTEKHHYWRKSIIPPMPVWVHATNPDHARQRIHLATIESPASTSSAKRFHSPWAYNALVRCTEDTSRSVPMDVAMLANGKITLKIPTMESC